MINELKELFRYRELLLNLVVRDLKVRYKNSVLGFFWSLLNPLLQVATITIVFKVILKIGVTNYSAYLLCAFLPWTFFQMSVMDSAMSVPFHANLVKKTYFPREVLPASLVLSNLVHFVLALGVFFGYLLVVGTPIRITWLILPVVVLMQLLLNMGVAFFVSCLAVFYNDVKYMATVVLNLLYFAMPIMYTIEHVFHSDRIPHSLIVPIYYLNPLSLLLIAYRKLLLPPLNTSTLHDVPFNYWYLALAGVVSLAVCLGGYAYFNSKKWRFAEQL